MSSICDSIYLSKSSEDVGISNNLIVLKSSLLLGFSFIGMLMSSINNDTVKLAAYYQKRKEKRLVGGRNVFQQLSKKR
jgi:hypothetical protein